MRKTALFSSLVVALTTLHVAATAQDIYIRFDGACVEKLEYRFVEQENGIAYSAYKVNKSTAENLYFETGVEVPQIRKSAPSKMVTCNALNIDRSMVDDINKGRRKAFIVKKLDSGWAYLPVGSAAQMTFVDNKLSYFDATSDFQADLNNTVSGNDLSLDKNEAEPKAAVYYIGEMTACNFTAYQFRKTPRVTCREDATIAVMPGLGLIQDFATGGQRFELVGINNTDVCGYYATPTQPEPVVAEPQPDVPQNYNVVATREPELEVPQTEYVAAAPPTIVESNITRSDVFGESTNPEVPQSYNTVVSKSTDTDPEPVCQTLATEGEHIVQRGESLYGIARRYGLTVNSLREWNGMTEDLIYPCSPLKVVPPVVVVAAPSMEEKRQNDVPQSYNTVAMPKAVTKKEVVRVNCNVEASEGEHVVLQGESLYGIARTYNLTVSQLKAWNSLAEDKIMLCQKLMVVAPIVEVKAVPTEYATVAVKKTAGPKVEFKTIPKQALAVKAKSVAPKTVKTIAKPKTIEPFMAKTVTISAKSVPTKQTVTFVKKGAGLHVVTKGETIIGLAKESNMSEAEFRKVNNLGKAELITVGQVLKMENCACNVAVDAEKSLILKPIPVASDIMGDVPETYNVVVRPKKVENTEGVELTSKSVETRTVRKYHVVQQSETLYSIAKTYGKKVADIQALNRLDNNEVLVPNQLLILE